MNPNKTNEHFPSVVKYFFTVLECHDPFALMPHLNRAIDGPSSEKVAKKQGYLSVLGHYHRRVPKKQSFL